MSLLQFQTYTLFSNLKTSTKINSIKSHLHFFQFTTVTSRSTSYLLFSFWIFFFFFGESLLLLTFNFITPIDTITSHSFFLVKQHIIFLTDSLSSNLGSSINFYIYFLTTSSLLYLIHLNFILNYCFFRQSLLTTALPTLILVI